jgi:hypothetical protein
MSLNKQRTYRTRSQSVAASVTGLIGVAIGIGMILEARYAEVWITGMVIVVLIAAYSARVASARISTSSNGIHVVNVFSSSRLAWDQIDKFDIGRSGIIPLVCRIHLRDGTTIHAFGIQERTNFPNGSAQGMANALNQELHARLADREG